MKRRLGLRLELARFLQVLRLPVLTCVCCGAACQQSMAYE